MSANKSKTPQRLTQYSATHTNVAGYFNANNWPVQIQINKINRNFLLQPGQYLIEGSSKVNDPVFEEYVGAMQLSREWAPNNAMLPIIRIVPITHTPLPSGFSGSTVRRDPVQFTDGHKPLPITAPAPKPMAPADKTNPVSGFSIEEARRRGLARPTLEPNARAPKDDGGVPPRGEMIEEIDFARDMSPGEARKNGILPQPGSQIGQTAAQVAGAEEVKLSPDPDFNPDNPNILTRVAQKVLNQMRPPSTPPVPPPQLVATPIGDLPEPNLEESISDDPRPLTPSHGEKPFICSVDGRGFNFRSELVRYATRKYPDQIEEILAKYPKR